MGQSLGRKPRAPQAFVLGRDAMFPFFHLYAAHEYCPHVIRKSYPAGTPLQVIRRNLIVVEDHEVFLSQEQFAAWDLAKYLPVLNPPASNERFSRFHD
jgi:hypothetical protein